MVLPKKLWRNTNDKVGSTERFFPYSPVFINSNISIFMCLNKTINILS